MKSLISVLLVVIFLHISAGLLAQTFGLKGGYTLSDLLLKEDGESVSDEFGMKSGFHFGPTLEWEISEGAGFETALLLTTKGIKMDETETYEGISYSSNAKVNLYYLDIPLMGKLYADVGNARIYGMLGPYVGIGLSGKTKVEEKGGSETYDEEWDIEWGSGDEDDLKRLGFGMAVGGGVEINSLIFEFSSHFGLNNISPQSDYDMVARNRTFMFSVGYKFHQ
ncbi:porin family protein [uncultured Draconibacterium sp.]|uniref:porin family protein n=1 Tax=uncultured Draconibacterium sp. TaxID=1573823 RepID=UPI0025DEEB71|nr:porin family protein [uncultured Draconibacterium sp.]